MNDSSPDPASDEALRDLRERLSRFRLIANPWSENPALGLLTLELENLLDHWSTKYDWRTHEARIRSLGWVVTGSGTSSLRSIHQPAAQGHANGRPTPVVLLHGWPDSVLRFERLLPLLEDFDVVVPALPGFPFAEPISEPVTATQMAHLVAAAMQELGYDHYVISGGDVGGTVAEILASEYPDRVSAVHLTSVAAGHIAHADRSALSQEAVDYVDHVVAWRRSEAGFIAEQSTRPSTLIAALGDSPAGLLAWIVEKLLAWSDFSDGAAPFDSDELLTWVSAYWFTGSIGTSFSTYVEPSPIPARVMAPTVISSHAFDIIAAPESFAEVFLNVRKFSRHASGGHFAAWEQPATYAADLRLAVSAANHVSA